MGFPLLILTLVVLGLGEGHQDPPPNSGHPHPHLYGPPKTRQDTAQVWLQTMGAALGVSLAPQLLLLLVPADSGSPRRRGLLRLLLSFAAGGLLGDAFLHLIPHALAPHEHHEGHGHAPHEHHEGHGHGQALSVGFWVLAGIVTFLAVELGVRHCGGHGHSHGPKAKASSSEDEPEESKGTKGTKGTKGQHRRGQQGGRAAMAVSGYLNLAADAAHNFTDGLALGAAFWGGPVRGTMTALSVLLHELPHELGDMALLLRAGCSKRQAMLLQLLTALAALAGAACSLLAEGGTSSSSSSSISAFLPFTAGGFIYLGTVSVLPELLREPAPCQALLQLLALLAGLAMMLLIAQHE